MGVKLAVVVLPGIDDVIILESRTLREKMNIDAMEALKAKALKLYELSNNDKVTICMGGTGKESGARYMFVSPSAV